MATETIHERMAKVRASKKPPRVPDCHPDRRHRAKGLCHSCYMVQWMKDHPDANTGNNWSRTHPEQHRTLKIRASLKRKYGMTEQDLLALWSAQDGLCANPGCARVLDLDAADFRSSLHVDHDHATGRIRGLLCPGCNAALGHLNDDPGRIGGLIAYLGLN